MAEAEAKSKFWRRDHLLSIEEQVRKVWDAQACFEADAPQPGDAERESYFVTFPYPYMNGKLHIGHGFSLTKAEFAARYQRLKGKNVLFPFGFHCTGMPICAAANKVRKELAPEQEEKKAQDAPDAAAQQAAKDEAELAKLGVHKGKKTKAVAKGGGMTQCNVLRQMGIPEEDIPSFADPNFWLKFFPPYAMQDLRRFGLACDWRRSFITTEMNPYYDAFIRWQFRKLKAKDYVKFGKREAIYSIEQGQPCADHDRSSGEGVGPQEYTLIKLKVQKHDWEEHVGDAAVYLVAATLRPETMYGQTNCFVLPEGDYGLYLMNNDEVFVTSRRAAINMYYQDLGELEDGAVPEALHEVKGQDLIGLPLSAPLTSLETVYVLPMTTIKMDKGTGIVTSVPADAPDDYACLNDFKTKENMRKQFNVDPKWCDVEIIPIIEIEGCPEYGTAAAPYVCEQMKVQNHKDKDKLALAKKEVYLKGFYQGVLIVGPHKGKKVQEAKTLVKAEMIADGTAHRYFEPENTVISRNGDECIVALCDQWYLTYNDEEWTKRVADHVDNNFEMFNPAAHNGIKHTVGWMGKWACSRQFGLGTRLPWDEAWLVESLSDSTIYMAWYTIVHLLQGGRIYGDHAGPYAIKAEDLTDADFDYIFGLADKLPSSKLPKAALEECRREFLYWYPMNLRVSGKDLIQNHLTMALFNHAAVWEDPKMWPEAYYCNGHVCVDAKKMSKSEGNFLTMQQCIDDYGADATRLACADAGDGLEDANFSRETANQTILKLTTLENFAKEIMDGQKGYRTGDLEFLDQMLLNELSRLVKDTDDGFSGMVYKNAVRASWYEMTNVKDEYRDLSNGDFHAEVIKQWLKTQCILLAPVCPHICEHIWQNILQEPGMVVNAPWPVVPDEDKLLSRKANYVRKALRSFRLDKEKAAKGKKPEPTTNAIIFVARKYKPFQEAALKALDSIELDATNTPVEKDHMRTLKDHPLIKGIDKADAKFVMPFASFMLQNDVKAIGKAALALELPFDEKAMLEARKDVIMRQLNVGQAVETITFAYAEDDCPQDAKNKRANAIPGAPVIVFHG